jgi:hypothetical protein
MQALILMIILAFLPKVETYLTKIIVVRLMFCRKPQAIMLPFIILQAFEPFILV